VWTFCSGEVATPRIWPTGSVSEGSPVVPKGRGVDVNKEREPNRSLGLPQRLYGRPRGQVGRKTVRPGRDGRERDGSDFEFIRHFEASPVAGRKKFHLLLLATSPDGPYRVDDPPRLESESGGGLGIPRGASTQLGTRRCQVGPPAARWMAPSTPPPPISRSFAALTIASTSRVVMSTVCVTM
jgi:hypothetical protein